ncbi:MAG: hypothetical protein JSS79_08570 [Bacteroidetes bacterium]|nr:hypothetical protein [Bacteroidota bacterium]
MITKCHVNSFWIALTSKRISLLHIPFLVILFAAGQVFAQSSPYTVNLPQLLPASPEPSAFVKSGVANTNMSTGAVNANIPLYTIKIKDFSFPISLSYSTQGLKADEASSRVGLGWVLNASGAVTRSVRGEPDEFSQRIYLPQDYTSDNLTTNSAYLYYAQASTSGSGFDSQPDEFQFHVNGYSGKFLLDSLYHAKMTSTTNIKIDVLLTVTPGSTAGIIDKIIITTPEGIRYQFGANYEISSDITMARFSFYNNVIRTSFFLDRIDLPTGEYINFNYTQINILVATGINQSASFSTPSGTETCQPCYSINSYSTSEDHVGYNTRYLNNIITSTGLSINFNYEQLSGMGHDYRLISLDVVGIKKYKFSYYDVPSLSTTLTQRFFLTKLSDITEDTVAGKRLDYNFIYDRMTQAPLPISYQQDYLGFYNANGSTYLIPPVKNSFGVMDFSFREPNSDAAKIGTLKSIIYPTGGREDYYYEPNTQKKIVLHNTNVSYNLDGPGGASSSISYVNNSVTVPFDQVVSLSAYCSDAFPYDGLSADPNQVTASVWVYEGSTLIGSRAVLGYTPTTTTFSLYAGHTYQLKMQVNRNTEFGSCSLTYNTVQTPVYDTINSVVPGIRIRQIKYTDPFTSTSHSKFYTYSSLAHPNISSGECLYNAFLTNGRYRKYCGDHLQFTTDCVLEVYSNSTTNQVYNYGVSGSPIYYSSVVESDDPNYANGGTEYTFFANDNGVNPNPVFGWVIPFIPGGGNPTLAGTLKSKYTFDSQKKAVVSEGYVYETLIDTSMPPSIYVMQQYKPNAAAMAGRLDAFDATRVNYGNYWIRLLRTNVVDYTGYLSNTSDYNYGSTSNVLPSSIVTTNSKGDVISKNSMYCNTYTSSMDGDPSFLGYGAMKNRNILSPVVDEKIYKNGVLLTQKHTLYQDWFNNGLIVTPQKVQVKESPADVLHDALIYDSYTSNGNPTQLHKANDASIAYVWDNTLGLPIAQAKNAAANQIAYSGFENNAFGNWTAQTGWSLANPGFTGSQSFTGILQFTVPTAGVYSISFWTTLPPVVKNGTSVVTGNIAKSVTLNSNTWNLYQYTFTAAASALVTVNGTMLDEVRLSPSTAIMETYSYKPFVGVASKADPNNMVTYFNYDKSGRLISLSDFKGNVLKTYEYHYQQQ